MMPGKPNPTVARLERLYEHDEMPQASSFPDDSSAYAVPPAPPSFPIPPAPPHPAQQQQQQQQRANTAQRQLREDLERVARAESLPGTRLIIARPHGVRVRDTLYAPQLHPALVISQARDGRSIMGVAQRTRDVDFHFIVPFLVHHHPLLPPRLDELRCIVCYNPASDACELVCASHHHVLVVGDAPDQCYVLRQGQIQTIAPGMWKMSVPMTAEAPPTTTATTITTQEAAAEAARPLVEFLLLRRRFEATVVETAFGAAGEAMGHNNNDHGAPPAGTMSEGSITEFVMGALRDSNGLSVDGPGVQNSNNKTMMMRRRAAKVAATPTTPTTTHVPVPEAGQDNASSSFCAQSSLARLRSGETAEVHSTVSSSSSSSSSSLPWRRHKAGAATDSDIVFDPDPDSDSYRVTCLGHIDQNQNSSVFACLHSKLPNSTLVAKILNIRPRKVASVAAVADSWQQEMKMLARLNHRNIVALRAYDARFFAIFLEHLPDSLSAYRDHMPRGVGDSGCFLVQCHDDGCDRDGQEDEEEARRRVFSASDAALILRDVASALAYLNRQCISHNDIKPSNIAFSRARGAVVLDFGLATLGPETPRRAGGTAWYVAPEAADQGRRGWCSNLWALGVVMLVVLGFLDDPEVPVGPPYDLDPGTGAVAVAVGPYGPVWDFTAVVDPNSPNRHAMEDWLEDVYLARDSLDPDHDLVHRLVYDMLERDPAYRVEASAVEEALRATGTTLTGEE